MDNELYNLIYDNFKKLDDFNKIDILIDFISYLKIDEKTKALAEYEKTKNEYNPRFNILQNNYFIYDSIQDQLCYDIK